MKQKLMMEQAGRLKPDDQPAKPSGVDESGMPDLAPGEVDDDEIADVTAHRIVPAERIATPRRSDSPPEEDTAMDEDTVAKPGTPVDEPPVAVDEDDRPLLRKVAGKLP